MQLNWAKIYIASLSSSNQLLKIAMELSKLVTRTNILINSTKKILLINKQFQILSSHYSLESTQLSSTTILIVLNSMQGLHKNDCIGRHRHGGNG